MREVEAVAGRDGGGSSAGSGELPQIGDETSSMSKDRSLPESLRCRSSSGDGSVRKSEGEARVGWSELRWTVEDIGHQV